MHRFEQAVTIAASVTKELASQRYLVDFCLVGRTTAAYEVRPHDAALLSLFHMLALVNPLPEGDSAAAGERALSATGVPRLIITAEKLAAGRPVEQVLLWE